jgi:two-component system phosphate regulon response regulator PhoB
VTAVDNGLAALSAARERPPDLVVLDVMMPGMSGIDVCRQLRGEPATAALPIILLTARAQEGDVEVGFGAGADDYVVKPFSPRELVSRVEAALARMRA